MPAGARSKSGSGAVLWPSRITSGSVIADDSRRLFRAADVVHDSTGPGTRRALRHFARKNPPLGALRRSGGPLGRGDDVVEAGEEISQACCWRPMPCDE